MKKRLQVIISLALAVCMALLIIPAFAKEAAEQILRAQNQRNDCDNILIDSEFEPYTVSGSHIFHSIFKDSMRFDAFMAKFNSDVLIERGKNNQGEDKVYIIKTTRGN